VWLPEPVSCVLDEWRFCCRALSTNNEDMQGASRPWDKGRDGFVMGEGAGVLLMESLEHAQARGANIICEYLGSAITCDAHHMTDPRPDGSGVGLCIENALSDAGELCLHAFWVTSDHRGQLCVLYQHGAQNSAP
jgi:3-oxoacyl-(acyl-carrier-protein) synthase